MSFAISTDWQAAIDWRTRLPRGPRTIVAQYQGPKRRTS